MIKFEHQLWRPYRSICGFLTDLLISLNDVVAFCYMPISVSLQVFPSSPPNHPTEITVSPLHIIITPTEPPMGRLGFSSTSHTRNSVEKKEKTQTQIRIDKIFWSKGFHIMPGLGPVFLEACMCGIASSSSPQPEDCGIRESFSYQKLPQQLLRLSVLKLDGSCFGILIGNPLLCI